MPSRENKLFKSICSILQDEKVMITFNFELDCAGEMIDMDTEGFHHCYAIAINPLLGDRIITLIHECCHIIYPALK